MNPLQVQSVALALVSMPFALRGFFAADIAAWAAAFAALLGAGAIAGLDRAIDNGVF